MCMQCNPNDLQPYQLDNETAEKCRQGTIHPTQCADPSATHCILSYFSRDSKKTIRERRCGRLSDISGCSTYYNYIRKTRHLIGAERAKERVLGDSPMLEVCVVGCEGDNCTVNAAPLRKLSSIAAIVWTLSVFYTIIFRVVS
ncbi:unnamed protein product [Enterobius vermicularis]|uniref:Uncharacterized protein n=1 Tax=Enterobius vermicularis TaxID=51028 RepID=A0A0N4VFQ8_ENTVE|nr:unnamed protein product [Enterobius vermicularis]